MPKPNLFLFSILFILGIFSCRDPKADYVSKETDGAVSAERSQPKSHKTKTKWEDLFKGNTSFVEGWTSYVIPDSMEFRKPSKVSLSIGDMNDADYLKQKVLKLSKTVAGSNIQSSSIKVGRKMSVFLTDPMVKIDPNFSIQAITQSEQIVDLVDNKSVDWLWNVIPLKQGAHELDLTIQIMIKNDLGENYVSVPVYSDKITVFSNQMASTTLHREDKIKILPFVEEKKKTDSQISFISILIGIIVTLITALFVKNKIIHKQPKFSSKEISRIELLITKNAKSALEEILEKAPKTNRKLRNKILLLISNYKQNEANFLSNIISDEDYGMNRSKIVKGALELLENFKTQKSQP